MRCPLAPSCCSFLGSDDEGMARENLDADDDLHASSDEGSDGGGQVGG